MDNNTQRELLKIVKKNYEEIAEHYAQTRQKKLWPELEKISQEIKAGDKILDVGCGSGKLLSAFGDKKINYIGIDPCEKFIDTLKKETVAESQQFLLGDILELGKIPEYNFDYVFAIAVLHHLPGKQLQLNSLKQLRNKIKPNGRIIISVWNLWSQKKFRRLIVKFFLLKIIKKNKMDFGDIIFDWKNIKDNTLSRRYYHAFYKRELKKLCQKANLKIIELYKDKFNYYIILEKKA